MNVHDLKQFSFNQPPRIVFKDIIPRRNLYVRKLETTSLFDDLSHILDKVDDGLYLLVDESNELPLIIRKKNNKLTKLHNYKALKHLHSSIIKNVLLDQDLSEEQRINILLYILYYYWTIRAETTYLGLITRVVVDIQNIISILLEKEDTLFRHHNISRIITCLRSALRTERSYMEII